MADAVKDRDKGDYFAPVNEVEACSEEYERFLFYVYNSHLDYVERANRNFRYFMGNGGQWTDTDRAYFENTLKRRCIEDNHILPAVQTATGEQIFTRADITFKPRKGQASEAVAQILSKLALHVQVDNGYHRKEKTLWKDGLIKQRGYFDIRMKFDENLRGNVAITGINPITVMPDIYAESYDPAEWKEVIRYMWLSLDEIQGMYGQDARNRAEATHGWYSDNPFSDEFKNHHLLDTRYGFGLGGVRMIYERSEKGEKRLRVIERQYYRWELSMCYVDPVTGDSQPVPPDVKQAEAEKIAAERGHLLAKVKVKRVYWRVSTRFVMLHDSYSPYRSYTIVPFFYIFDYGTTLGMVDNAVSPQDLRNKALSNGIHIFNSTANGGWKIKKGSLTNMTPQDLETYGSKTGIVLEWEGEAGDKPEKIQPGAFPEGLKFLMDVGKEGIKDTTGMQDADQMLRSHMAGDSTQSAMFQQKLQLADPLDNLEFTRTLVGRKFIELVQDFYTSERIFKVTSVDPSGKEFEEEFKINEVQADGTILNDITLGEYDVIVDTKPTAKTWLQSQFQEALKMKELGVALPDSELIRRSSLDNKHELADQMDKPKDDGGAAAADAQLTAAKAKKMESDANASDARAIQSHIEGIYGAINAAQVLAQTPGAAPIADELLLSSGFSDAQIPEPIRGAAAPPTGDIAALPPSNPHPNFPALPPSATSGADAGIEGGTQ
jgi:hypothetical protein